jgi:hypothetical protein
MLRNFKGERKELRQEFRDDMQERHDWMMGSTTPGMATPTPWRNMRDNMKDMREDMRGKMASLTDAQMASITAKLGITIDQLKAQLATGTPLRQIVGNKISREDMMNIMPPMMGTRTMATGSMPIWRDHSGDDRPEPPQGFFNSMRMRFFGGNDQDNNGNVDANANVNANANPNVGFGGFFRRLFNF